MPRSRGFDTEAAVTAARDVFWERGYEGASLFELERATGLNRSSLYWAFGDKQGLFRRALALYVETFITPLLEPMRAAGADGRRVEAYFRELAARFRSDPVAAQRGCLWVNSIAESAGRTPAIEARAAEFRQLLHGTFRHALMGDRAGRAGVRDRRIHERRARLVATATFGLWLTVRIDPQEAARNCDAIAADVRSWRSRVASS